MITSKEVTTYSAKVYTGILPGYGTKDYLNYSTRALNWLRGYAIANGVAFETSQTEFIYPTGSEEGLCISFINYPRYPNTPEEVREKATNLAKNFMKEFKQYRVSIVCSDRTIMLEQESIE